jgi:hypothetical protein
MLKEISIDKFIAIHELNEKIKINVRNTKTIFPNSKPNVCLSESVPTKANIGKLSITRKGILNDKHSTTYRYVYHYDLSLSDAVQDVQYRSYCHK